MVRARSILFALSLAGSCALAQGSSDSSSDYTIQTSPPDPTSTTNSGASSSSDANSSTTATTTSIDASSTSAFPGACSSDCQTVADALTSCGAGTVLNTTCLCTVDVEQSYQSCLQCALALDPKIGNQSTYQGMLDTYINQCATASSNPITLPPATITMPANASTTSPTNGTNSTITSTFSNSTSTTINTSPITSSSSSSSRTSSSAATSAASTSSSGAVSGAGEKVVYSLGVGLVGLMVAVLV
ncbi:hypothetical protein CNBG_2966 [Cryptococcus deuterogattii R265]|uniref:uncharacterized protein n=1 Tax=Cryptococcus deuterogattii (strain R265) TaxID=294750 RepID=UPI001938D99F|nr:hypothetical protein CNBG_2966 [Cryptococcus deuterogattii R265]